MSTPDSRADSRAGGAPARRRPAKRVRAPRPRRISGRAAALVVVLFALGLAYAYPVRVYLSQQAEIDRLVAAQEAQRQRITALRASVSQWDDEEYVIAQARWRLRYVRPGENAYIVLDDKLGPTGSGADPAGGGSWLEQVWANIRTADNPRADQLPP